MILIFLTILPTKELTNESITELYVIYCYLQAQDVNISPYVIIDMVFGCTLVNIILVLI